MQKKIRTISNNISIILLAISSSLLLLRSNIPYAIYIFAFIQSVLLINLIKKNNLAILLKQLKKSISSFYAYYIVIIFFILAFIIEPSNTEVYKDLVNLAILLSFIILFIIEINSLKLFNQFKQAFLVSFILLFSAYLLVVLSISIINTDLGSFFFTFKNAEDIDRNMYTLNIWISIIALIYIIVKQTDRKKEIIPANIYLFLLLILVLLSASRRGIVILVIFSILFILFKIYGIIKKKELYKKFNTLFYLYLLGFLIMAILVMVPNMRSSIANKELRTEISLTTFRYYKLLKPDTEYKEYLQLLWGNNEETLDLSIDQLMLEANKKYKAADYTQSINLIQQAAAKTDSISLVFELMPPEIKGKIQIQDNAIIPYLPELLKLPYTYSNFFSCIDIKKLFLENLRSDTISHPYVFSFKKDSVQINLTLPALAKSEYELNFQITANNNPLRKIIINNNTGIDVKKNISTNKDTTLFSYHFSIKDNVTNTINLSLSLINNVDSFTISDMKWKLLSTGNLELTEKIYKKAKKGLKKFKFEQKRSKWLWNHYLNTEKLTNPVGQKKYAIKEIKSFFYKIQSKIKPIKYVATKVEAHNDTTLVIYDAKNSFPRARFDLPIVQNATYKIEFIYYHLDSPNAMVTYLKRKPEMLNVVLKKNILSDTTFNLNDNWHKKTLTFKIDSVNSATALCAFGFTNLKENDTLLVTDVKFDLQTIETDSTLLSEAQYTYLKNWAERGKQDEELIALKKELKQYENKDYWQIDSAVYETSAASRLELWLFGWQYFKSQPLQKRIFGDGFSYYHIYKLRFGTKYGSTEGFSPHNPVVSALLYSGLLGAIAYMFFLLQVFYYYFKNRKELGIFVLLFLLIFIYSFISGQTHFTISYFVLFSIFPFLINFINNRA